MKNNDNEHKITTPNSTHGDIHDFGSPVRPFGNEDSDDEI
jgi:hypothetical protein